MVHNRNKEEQHWRLVARIVEEFARQASFTPPKTELNYSQALFLARSKTNPSAQTVRMFAAWSVAGKLDYLATAVSTTWELGFEGDDRKISSGRTKTAPEFLAMLDGSSPLPERHKLHIWEHLIREEKEQWEDDPNSVSKKTLSELGVSFASSTKPKKTGAKPEMQRTNTRPARRARTYG